MNFLVVDSSTVSSNYKTQLDLGIPGLEPLIKTQLTHVIQAILSFARIALQVQSENPQFTVFYGSKVLFPIKSHSNITNLEFEFSKIQKVENLNVEALKKTINNQKSQVYLITENKSQHTSLKKQICTNMEIQLKTYCLDPNQQILSKDSVIDDSCSIFHPNQLEKRLVNLAEIQYFLIKAKITDFAIPTSQGRSTIGELALKICGSTVEITQDLFYRKLNFKLVSSDSFKTLDSLPYTISTHQVVLESHFSNASVIFAQTLLSGKPILLLLETEYNLKYHKKVSHYVLQHGDLYYLHVLNPGGNVNLVLNPTLNIPKIQYRDKEFQQIVVENMIYPPEMIKHKLSEGDSKGILQMQKNGQIYDVPTLIEKKTRLFPLCHDKDSILFNSTHFSPLKTVLQQEIIPYMYKESISNQEMENMQKIINKIWDAFQSGENEMFPDVSNTQRFETYKRAWYEMKLIFSTYRISPLVEEMEKLWPQFFYEKKESIPEMKRKKMVEVQRDKMGNPIFPISFGALTIHDVGKVVWDRPAYHTDKYIWPVGFKSTRVYSSVKNIDVKIVYTCEILDGGAIPSFSLNCSDFDEPIVSLSATGAWTSTVKTVNDIKSKREGRKVQTNVSGPEYFGLAHPTVMKLISELPNAEKCLRPNAPHTYSNVNKEGENDDEIDEDSQNKKEILMEENMREVNRLKWEPNVSYYDFVKKKNQILNVGFEFDGKLEGPNGLYSHVLTEKKRKHDKISDPMEIAE